MFVVTGSRQENGILTISNTQPDYSGRYVCSIVLRTGPSGAGYVVLTVTRTGPSKSGSPRDMKSMNFLLKHNYEGHPTCHISV